MLLYVDQIKRFLAFCDRVLSLTMMTSKFLYVVACVCFSLFFFFLLWKRLFLFGAFGTTSFTGQIPPLYSLVLGRQTLGWTLGSGLPPCQLPQRCPHAPPKSPSLLQQGGRVFSQGCAVHSGEQGPSPHGPQPLPCTRGPWAHGPVLSPAGSDPSVPPRLSRGWTGQARAGCEPCPGWGHTWPPPVAPEVSELRVLQS